MDSEKLYVECDCSSADHVIRFMYDHADEKLNFSPQVYMEVQMVQPNNIFKRIVKALEYIFNRESEYGHWDCTLINTKEATKLRDLLTYYIAETNNYEKDKKVKQ